MKLLVIRHGESEADLLNVHEGRADFNLTDRGRLQAKSMSNWVKARYNISKIYSSPLKRALQTATYLSEAANVDIILDDNLMEFNNGLLAGLQRNEALEKYPPLPDLPIHQAVYQMESKLMFRYRADVALSQILSENDPASTIAIVSHGGMINQLYHSFLKLAIDCSIHFATGDTGIHEWRILDDIRYIHYSNSCIHTIDL